MEKTIIEGLEYLESTEVSFLAMPCNSAHLYYDNLKEVINIPLLNIVDETLTTLEKGRQRITVLATATTFESKIYQRGIRDAGHKFVFQDEWQAEINSLIKMFKTGADQSKMMNKWKELLAKLRREKIDTAIIGCTDLTLFKNKVDTEINLIDSSEELARTVVKRYLTLRNQL